MTEVIVAKQSDVMIKNEDTLLMECDEIWKKFLLPAYRNLLLGYWELGSKIIQYEAEGWIERRKGDQTIRKIGTYLHVHYVNLYSAIKLASLFPSANSLRECILRRERDGMSVTWTSFKREVLPTNPPHLMSKKTIQEETLNEAERVASRLEDLTQKIMEMKSEAETEEDKEIAKNVEERLRETLQEHTDILQAIPKKKREKSREYLDWIKSQPEWQCIMHGFQHDPENGMHIDPHHIKSRGAGGSDFDVIPVCRECHGLAETGQLWRDKTAIIALFHWAYAKPAIDERYLRETT